jgi:hypothetical protein
VRAGDPAFQRVSGFVASPQIQIAPAERIMPAADDLGCRELLS